MAERRPGPGSILPWMIALLLLAFIIGMIGSPWFERQVRPRLPFVAQESDLGAINARLEAQQDELTRLETRIAALEQRPQPAVLPPGGTAALAGADPAAEGQPALNDPVLPELTAGLATERLGRVQNRVDALDRQQTLLGNRVDNLSAEVAGLTVRVEDTRGETSSRVEQAERLAREARAVVLLSRARSAFETGQPVDNMAPALRAAFGPDSDEDVDRLVAGMRDIAGPGELQTRFAALRPTLLGAADAEADAQLSWWQRILKDLGSIFTIRRSGEERANDANEQIVEAVSNALDEGNVAAAVSTYARLPEPVRAEGQRWFRDALRYARTKSLLDRLETRAVIADAPGAVAPLPPQPVPEAPPVTPPATPL